MSSSAFAAGTKLQRQLSSKEYGGQQRQNCAAAGAMPLLLCLLWLLLLSAMALAMLFMFVGKARQTDHGQGERRLFGTWDGEADEAETEAAGRRRLRRQVLPTDNVRVYATNSNVSVTDRVQVLSAESRIQLLAPHQNATIWSNGSLLQMSPNGQEVALSASQAIGLLMALHGGARVEAAGDSLQLNESNRPELTSPSEVWSRMEAELAGPRVNLSWLDAGGTLGLRAMDARMAALVSLGWDRPAQRPELSVLSAAAANGGNGSATADERELSIAANSPAYQVQIRLIGAQTSLQFRGARLDIPPAHRSLTLRWQGWLLRVQSLESPFEVHATTDELSVNCYEEALTVRVSADAIGLEVGRLSRLLANRSATAASPASLRVNGGQIGTVGGVPTDLAELLSRQLRLSLSRDRQLGLSVLADARHSQLKLAHANRTSATLTAVRHFVELLGGRPALQLLAGNVSVQMQSELDGETSEKPTEQQQLDTDILPRELLQAEAAGQEDIFGIGPIAPTTTSSPSSSSPATPIVRPAPTTTAPEPAASTSSVPSSSAPLNISSSSNASITSSSASTLLAPATPRMEQPSELFTFRQSFPSTQPPETPAQSESAAAAAQQVDAFPSPQPGLFTFPPTGGTAAEEGTPDADFLVGQFETATTRRQRMVLPISATISSMQMPTEEQQEGTVEDFPGIRRENRFIWRPEQAQQQQEVADDVNGMSKSVPVESGDEEANEQRRPRQIGNSRAENNESSLSAEVAMKNASRAEQSPPLQTDDELLLELARAEEDLHLSDPAQPAVHRSPALVSISAHSLPVLPLGLLALGLSLLTMLAILRPSAKAIQMARQWLLMRRHRPAAGAGVQCPNLST